MKPSQRHENGHVLELGLLLDIRDMYGYGYGYS